MVQTSEGRRWLDRAAAGIRSRPDREAVRAELEAHLEDKTADLVRIFPDLGRQEAERQAVEQADNYAGLEIIDVADYQDAVSIADSRAVEGDVVILSPASTSFDRFANFMERGRVFKEIVNALP